MNQKGFIGVLVVLFLFIAVSIIGTAFYLKSVGVGYTFSRKIPTSTEQLILTQTPLASEVPKDFHSCLPGDLSLTAKAEANTPEILITVEERLIQLGATCSNSGLLVDQDNKKIGVFYFTACLHGAPGSESQEIRDKNLKNFKELDYLKSIGPVLIINTCVDNLPS